MMDEETIGGMPKWQVEGDLDTLTRAAEIRRDKKRMKAIRKCAKKKAADLEAITSGAGGFRDVDEDDY